MDIQTLIYRLYKHNPSDTLEGVCQFVDSANLTETETRIIIPMLAAITRLPRYFGVNGFTDPQDAKDYEVVYCYLKFHKEASKNINNLIPFISNYKNDAYVDEQIKVVWLLRTGKKWDLVDQFPDSKNIQLIGMFHDKCSYTSIKETIYQLYDDRCKIMLSHIDPQEYALARDIALIWKFNFIHRKYVTQNSIPLSEVEYYDDHKNLIGRVKKFYGQFVADKVALSYHASMASIHPSSEIRVTHRQIAFNIQAREFRKSKYYMSLFDILMCLLNKYNQSPNAIDRVNCKKMLQYYLKNYYDIMLELKTLPINYFNWVTSVRKLRYIVGDDLCRHIDDDFYNEFQLNKAMRSGRKFCNIRIDAAESCLICFDNMSAGHICVRCLGCNNVIGCRDCVDIYLKSRRACPLCRQ